MLAGASSDASVPIILDLFDGAISSAMRSPINLNDNNNMKGITYHFDYIMSSQFVSFHEHVSVPLFHKPFAVGQFSTEQITFIKVAELAIGQDFSIESNINMTERYGDNSSTLSI
ncbi:hypothetical protein BLOT_005322 [Blomia tropicalis]|nr:hypothetical protein BLOT_005322 [Blomia tropicalis]